MSDDDSHVFGLRNGKPEAIACPDAGDALGDLIDSALVLHALTLVSILSLLPVSVVHGKRQDVRECRADAQQLAKRTAIIVLNLVGEVLHMEEEERRVKVGLVEKVVR